jgi:molybdopterin synthase catalytic subunit
MVIVTENPINPATAYDLISPENAGSAVFHYAIVKGNTGSERTTSSINYQKNGDMTAEMETIATELRDKWSLDDVLLVRRIGSLAVGEIISLVAASSPNSADAFEACQLGISRLKRMVTVKKEEVFR